MGVMVGDGGPLLVTCPAHEVRHAFSRLLVTAFTSLSTNDKTLVRNPTILCAVSSSSDNKILPFLIDALQMSEQGMDFMEPTSAPFIMHLMSQLEEMQEWRTHSSFWWVIKRYTACGYNERRFMVEKEFVSLLIDYYMGEFSPYWIAKGIAKRVQLGGVNELDLRSFSKALANLICVTRNDVREQLLSIVHCQS